VSAATQAAGLWRWATVDVSGLTVAIDDAEISAHVTGEVVLQAARPSGEPERDGRSVSIRLDKIDGDWRIVSIAVSARQDAP
jgi:phosphoribosylformylglycinamidine synthase